METQSKSYHNTRLDYSENWGSSSHPSYVSFTVDRGLAENIVKLSTVAISHLARKIVTYMPPPDCELDPVSYKLIPDVNLAVSKDEFWIEAIYDGDPIVSEHLQISELVGHFKLSSHPLVWMKGGLSDEEIKAKRGKVASVEIEAIVDTKAVVESTYCHCGQEWTSTWDCEVDDECPVCKRDIEPCSSEVLVEASTDRALPGQTPDFYSVYIRQADEAGEQLATCVADFKNQMTARRYAFPLGFKLDAQVIDNVAKPAD